VSLIRNEFRSGPDPDRGSEGTGSDLLLHDFFERSVQRSPESVAVELPPGPGHPTRVVVTYAELAGQADVLARELRAWIVRESVVAILLPRDSTLLYAAQIAVLKAGASYTCIDPTFPMSGFGTCWKIPTLPSC
jgi:non-ribosomal peptide synthetase component F